MKFAGILIILGIVLFAIQFFIPPKAEKLYESCQPKEVTYESFDPYCLSIVKYNSLLSTKTVLSILKSVDNNGQYSYGHHIMYFEEGSDRKDFKIENAQTLWSPEGVLFQNQSGHQIFFPKKLFIGGR